MDTDKLVINWKSFVLSSTLAQVHFYNTALIFPFLSNSENLLNLQIFLNLVMLHCKPRVCNEQLLYQENVSMTYINSIKQITTGSIQRANLS